MEHTLDYAPVPMDGLQADLQLEEVNAAGCGVVCSHRASVALDRRHELDEVLEQRRPGDGPLVLWRLEQLGRSLRILIGDVARLDERGGRLQAASAWRCATPLAATW